MLPRMLCDRKRCTIDWLLRFARPLPRGRLATVWCISILKRCANSFHAWDSNNLSRSKTFVEGSL